MRVLGIDFGLKRVGVAVGDTATSMAFPRPLVQRTTRQKLFDDLAAIIQEESVEHIVVGLPLAMDGSDTETTRQARNFAESLARRTDADVVLHDERLSSAEAEERLKEAGLCAKKRKTKLDSQAATVILQSWLDANP